MINVIGQFLPASWLMDETPEYEFCVFPYFPNNSVSIIAGHGGSGKSLFAIMAALHISLNINFVGTKTKQCKVGYLSIEDSELIVRKRVYTIAQQISNAGYGIIGLTQQFMFIDRFGIDTSVVKMNSGNIANTELIENITDLLISNNIGCLFVDTLVRSHCLNENDNSQMSALLMAYEKIAKNANCSVVLIHHLSKTSENRSYAIRGASAIVDNARSVIMLEKVGIKEAQTITDELIKNAAIENRLIRVKHIKHNYSKQHPDKYLLLQENGTLLEVNIQKALANNEQLIHDLFIWWQNIRNCRPFTETNIIDNLEKIRPVRSKIGKRPYCAAFKEGINKGLLQITSTPEGGSNNNNSKYYIFTKDPSTTLHSTNLPDMLEGYTQN